MKKRFARAVSTSIWSRSLGWSAIVLSAWSLVGCGSDPVDQETWRSIDALTQGDECDTTSQCRTIYGSEASDCKNSASTDSVCMCGTSACDNSPIGQQPSAPPSIESNAVTLLNKGQGLPISATEAQDGSTSESCGGPTATNVRLGVGDDTSFYLQPVEGEWFRIVSQKTGRLLQSTQETDVSGADAFAVRMVDASEGCTGTWTQWRKVDAGGGFFRLESRAHQRWLQGISGADRDTSQGKQLRTVATTFTGDLTRFSEGDTPGSDNLGPSDPGNPAVYTGRTHWNASTGTLTYLSDGTLPNSHQGWNVPSSVKRIVIAAGVRLTGRFDVSHTMVISGEDRATSEIYGTPIQGYNKKNDGCGECKSAVRGEGNITVTVKNLTSRDPFGFHFTGKAGAKFVVDSVNAVDDRGGHGNNSDGISAASGTVVRNSYFESGDDIIKVYADIEVIDTTIAMVENTVPIQFGWGSYGSGAHGKFKNLTVTGTGGRYAADNAMISARKGTYNKTIEIDGLTLNNPNASVMIFREARGSANISITNAKIDVKKFKGSLWTMDVSPNVCGVTYPNGNGAPAHFDCRN